MRLREWIHTNITGIDGNGDFVRDTTTNTTNNTEPVDIDLQDFPSPPEPGQSVRDFVKGTLFETAQGFILSVLSKVLAHVVEKSESENKK